LSDDCDLAFPPRIFACGGSPHKWCIDYPWLCYCCVITVVLPRTGAVALLVERNRFHCTKMLKLHSESLFAILGFSFFPIFSTLWCSLISYFFHFSLDAQLGLVFHKSLLRPTKAQPVISQLLTEDNEVADGPPLSLDMATSKGNSFSHEGVLTQLSKDVSVGSNKLDLVLTGCTAGVTLNDCNPVTD